MIEPRKDAQRFSLPEVRRRVGFRQTLRISGYETAHTKQCPTPSRWRGVS